MPRRQRHSSRRQPGQYEAATGQLAAAKGVLDEVNLNLGQTSQYAPATAPSL